MHSYKKKCLAQSTCMLEIDSDINGLAQDCSNSIADALELLQSCT